MSKNSKFLMVILLISSIIRVDVSNDRSLASSEKTIADINFRRIFLSFDHSQGYRGLLHFQDDYEYTRRLFGQIIQKAHEISKEDWYRPEVGVYKHHNLFLLLSLLVPHHESALMHFTRRSKEQYCYFSNDALDPIHPQDFVKSYYQEQLKLLETLGGNEKELAKKRKSYESKIRIAGMLEMGFNTFNRALGENKISVKHCDKIKTNEVYQLMFSGDYADIGMFMLNAYSHGGFFARRGIFNFDQVVDYALNYLYKGFKYISLNNDKYDCLAKLQETNFKQYSENLLKGSWAGKYNSGNTKSTCRFKDDKHKFAANDKAYARSYKKFFDAEDFNKNIFYKYLPEGSLERKAYLELLDNVNHETNTKVYLGEILKTNYHSESEMVLTDENDVALDISVNDVSSAEKPNHDNSEDSTIDVEAMPAAPYVDFDFELLQHSPQLSSVIISKNANIRSQAEISSNNICVNTKKASVFPIAIEVLEQKGKWLKVMAKNLIDLFENEKCQNLNTVYIHSSLVKLVEDFSRLGKIKLNTTVTIRDGHNAASQIIGNLGPAEYYLLQSKVLEEKNIWLQILSDDGQKAWFYAGQDGNLVYDPI